MACLLFATFVVLFSLCDAMPDKKQCEGRVYFDSEFEGTIHCDDEVKKTVAGHGTSKSDRCPGSTSFFPCM